MIDKLPLDIFEDPPLDPPAATALPADAPATAEAAPEPAGAVQAPPTRRRRVYDAIAIVGLAIGVGLVLRVIGLGVLTPVANVVAAFIIYSQLKAGKRAAYFSRMDALRDRLDQEVASAGLLDCSSLPAEQRRLYDGLAIVVIAVASALLAFLLGINRWLPMAWLFPTAAGAGAYVWMARPYRPTYYALAERTRHRLTAAWNSAGRHQ